jgi:enoyl-CoA hydratase/carnithine racemase
VWKVCAPDDLLTVARDHANILAAKPISSLVAVKRSIAAPLRPHVEDANTREIAEFRELLGGAANVEALVAFRNRGPPARRSMRSGRPRTSTPLSSTTR